MTITALPTRPVLDGRLADRVVFPSDPAWDEARGAFNLRVDQQPVAIVQPLEESDVIAAVRYARAHGLRIAPQSTGHNAGPLGPLHDDTIIVDVSGLDEVAIDADALRVRVGAGVRWEQVVPALSELGLAALHGSSPDVGIAGYSLGGGMGWLARKHGLQTNSVTAFELVTADGHLVRADAVHEPDLFWALRGGGGNFGVVTAIEFAVYPYAELFAGACFFPFARTREVLHAWHNLLPALPDELMTWAAILHFPPDPALPDALRGGSFVVVWGVFTGTEGEGRRLMAPVRELGPLMDTFAMVPPAMLGDLAMDPRDPLPFLSGHQLLDDVPAEAIDALADVVGPDSGATISMVQLRHLGGALARADADAGARATLPGSICVFSLGVAPDAGSARDTRSTLSRIEAALAPYRVGDYPNFVEKPSDARSFFDAQTWWRLREVKALYDPSDLFRANHSIPPHRRAS
ncbi:MAG: FAD-binding oxidoreductase [Solirubrobacterales bacterium]